MDLRGLHLFALSGKDTILNVYRQGYLRGLQLFERKTYMIYVKAEVPVL